MIQQIPTNCVQASDDKLRVLLHIIFYLSARRHQLIGNPGHAGARIFILHLTVVQFLQRNTTRTGCVGTSKVTGFQVTLQYYKSGGCGTKQEQVIITQSRTTLCACLEELCSQIEERHGGDCVKAVQAFNSAQEIGQLQRGC